MRAGIIASNRRRHGTAAAASPGTSDFTAYRGALTKSGHGAVNLGNLISPSFNSTSSTYTLSSGTSGHWTTPTDGSLPTPTATGDIANLNGGPYVFAYTCTDGTQSFSGNLTINVRANTYTASKRSELAVILSSGIEGTTVEFAKAATDLGLATNLSGSRINFNRWRSTAGCTIKHEDPANPCTVGNTQVIHPKNLTFDGIVLTPSARASAANVEQAWHLITQNTAAGDELVTNSVTLTNCGVTGSTDVTQNVYGVYIEGRFAPLTLTTHNLKLTYVQYGVFHLYNGNYQYTANLLGRTAIRYWTIDANRLGANGTPAVTESIYYEDLVCLSPMFDSSQAAFHADSLQGNTGSVFRTGAVVIDRFTVAIADGNVGTQGYYMGHCTGGVTLKNMIYVNREQNAVFVEATDALDIAQVGNVTAINQWSGGYGPDLIVVPATGERLNAHPDGTLNTALVIRSTVDNNYIQLKNMFFVQAPAILNSPAYTPPASITHNSGSADLSAILPNASWISSASLKATALLPANDVDYYTGLADARWSADTDTVVASVVAALTPASGQVGAVASDGSRPLATFP